MTDRFSEDDVVMTVTRLTRRQLVRFIEGNFIKPQLAPTGYVFRQIDIARLELLCDLSMDLDLDETGLGIVISLIDQLHTARQDLAVLARAVDNLPPKVRSGVLASLGQT
ncbi:chaperone modulatory protein CbpM [Yoonia maritima]|uniref:Chaperone modulatory protein CbpM n=1 Tax=Yoonia maritima TaxID=1435347 RepID=A0A2T0W4Z1_9RHOB|nr:chaperone modulator CbpM [Yoonia maritima]PRY80546.1 chaperone modulatory protein CbpM [Yoonia maritima]